VGTLYDNITTDGEINIQDRGNWGSGHGWSGANQVLWNCKVKSAAVQSPWLSAKNYCIGMTGEQVPGRLANKPNGEWEGLNQPGLTPASLYLAQKAQKPAAAKPRRGTSQGDPNATLSYTPGKAPKFWSVATAETVMARYPDYRTAYYKDFSYVHGYMFYGFEMLYKATGDKKYLDFIKNYIDKFVDEQGRFQNGGALNNLDALMTGNAIVMLYEITRDERYKKAAGEFRHAFDDYPRNPDGGFWHGSKTTGQMWVDGIFMGQMFLVRYGKSIGDSEYAYDEATKQITVFARHALKGNSGLYYHAFTANPELVNWANPATGLSPEVWSEGLGWYALVIAETLATIPKNHPRYNEVADLFQRLAKGLKDNQDPKSGRWYQVVDKGNLPDNWTDISGSAMFTYALQRGIQIGLLDKSIYQPVVKSGYEGITNAVRINEKGLVEVSPTGDGVTVKKDYATYVSVPKVLNAKEAVAGFLWATALYETPELLKARK
jgi:unsaturated rhamnogalacturonyl hydrolase